MGVMVPTKNVCVSVRCSSVGPRTPPGWITRFVEGLLAEHRRFAAGRESKPLFDQNTLTTSAVWHHAVNPPKQVTS